MHPITLRPLRYMCRWAAIELPPINYAALLGRKEGNAGCVYIIYMRDGLGFEVFIAEQKGRLNPLIVQLVRPFLLLLLLLLCRCFFMTAARH